MFLRTPRPFPMLAHGARSLDEHGKSMIAAMLAPRELAMYRDWAAILRRCAGGGAGMRKINCFGAGESAVEAKLDITKRGHVPEVAPSATPPFTRIRQRLRSRSCRPRRFAERLIRERLVTGLCVE